MRPRRSSVLLAGVLGLVLVAATAPGDDPAGQVDPVVAEVSAGERCDELDQGHCLFPWPNDHFTVTDGSSDTGRRLALHPLSMPRNAAGEPIDPTPYNRNDGFSPGQMIVTKVPGLDTPQAFAHTDPVTLRDLSRFHDPGAPVVVIDAESGERHPIWVELDRAEDLDRQPPTPDDTALLIRPAANFEEGRRYIVALRDLRDADGDVIEAQHAFRELRDAKHAKGRGHRDDRGPNDRPEATGRAAHYEQDIFPVLEDADIDRETLYLAWDFTVASERNLSERMLHLRDDAFGQLGDTDLADLQVEGVSPTFVVDEVTQRLPCRPEVGIGVPPVDCEEQEDLDPRLARRVEGRVIVPCYLDQPGCPSGSQFAYAGPAATVPTRVPGNTTAANFVCNIPAGAAAGETFRPSLYGHGLFGSADQVNDWKLYVLAEHGLMFCATDWIGMAEEDIPNALSLLVDLSRFPTLTDRVQQGMLNFLYLGRAMIHPDGFASHPAFRFDDGPAIDTSRLYYNGGSQGGIIGGSLTAVAPDFTRAHLGVPGMNYSTLLRRSVDFDIFAEVMYRSYPDELERPLIISMVQLLWDRAEANGYAHHMTDDPLPNTPPHEVILDAAFADHQVTSWSADVMARTVGAQLRLPALDPGRHPSGDHAYWGIDPIGTFPFHGSAYVIADVGPLRDVDGRTKGTTPMPIENRPNRQGVDPHGPDFSEEPEGHRMIGEFLSPAGAMLTDPCGDIPCYLDGWTGP